MCVLDALVLRKAMAYCSELMATVTDDTSVCNVARKSATNTSDRCMTDTKKLTIKSSTKLLTRDSGQARKATTMREPGIIFHKPCDQRPRANPEDRQAGIALMNGSEYLHQAPGDCQVPWPHHLTLFHLRFENGRSLHL